MGDVTTIWFRSKIFGFYSQKKESFYRRVQVG